MSPLSAQRVGDCSDPPSGTYDYNAYCLDNEIIWMDWNLNDCRIALLDFTPELIQMRRNHPDLRCRKFYKAVHGTEEKDIGAAAHGQESPTKEWGRGWGPMLYGETLGEMDESGEPIKEDTFLITLNYHHELIRFYVPKPAM